VTGSGLPMGKQYTSLPPIRLLMLFSQFHPAGENTPEYLETAITAIFS
jgi:hypothetical protein